MTPRAILALYAATLFVGAGLLFVVQPMVGKMILPILGGTPAVWSTCMVFFQGALLAGYAYAHASTRWLGVRRGAALHLLALAAGLAALPIAIQPGFVRAGAGNPVLDVLLLLALSAGLPFVVVSATAPLLQNWFTHTGHPAARDPYFLYAASNLGSMLALLGYPVLLEPRLHLRGEGFMSQIRLWSLGYGALAALAALCAVILWRSARSAPAPAWALRGPAEEPEPAAAPRTSGEERPVLRERLRWIALAFVPSSLLLGATTYITTDIAAVPLLWVIPLAIYLLTFIIAFGAWPAWLHRAVVSATLPLVCLVIFLMLADLSTRIWLTVVWHLLLLLVVGLGCHGELARLRPSSRRLTEFYLFISVGGVLGGLFNALLAPLVFSSLAEYPLAMALACVVVARPRADASRRRTLPLAVTAPLGVGVLALALYSGSVSLRIDFAFPIRALGIASTRIAEWLTHSEHTVNQILIYAPPLVLCAVWRRRPVALGLTLAAVLTVAGFVDARKQGQVLQTRSFFGVLRVSRDDKTTGYTELRHGTTLHGRQSRDPARRSEPLSYYHRLGPLGQVFAELDRRDTGRRVAVIGLGTGTVAAYARPGEAMTIYEIDRAVRDIAFDPAYFTYTTDARDRGASLRVELGDARIRLESVRRERPGERYDLIVVDAFTSDAIPVHLLTREALRLYVAMLAPHGIVAIHISNRHLRLEPVVANLAEDAKLGGRLLMDEATAATEGGIESTWAVLARTPEALGALIDEERSTETTLAGDPRVGVWTDDFHNLLSVFKW